MILHLQLIVQPTTFEVGSKRTRQTLTSTG